MAALWLGASCAGLLVAACDDGGECAAGELRYAGRPPRALFSYDTTCRADCFSEPRERTCEEACESVAIAGPPGLLDNDRTLHVFDPDSLGEGRALGFSFGYVDEAGGSAPAGWSFLLGEERPYVSDEIEGTARFVMLAAVLESGPACAGGCGSGLCVDSRYCAPACAPATPDPCGSGRACGDTGAGQFACRFASPGAVPLGRIWTASAPTGKAAAVTPGRLEITHTSPERIAGRFFLGWETPTGKAQGQVNGCFDVDVGPATVDPDGVSRRRLSP